MISSDGQQQPGDAQQPVVARRLELVVDVVLAERLPRRPPTGRGRRHRWCVNSVPSSNLPVIVPRRVVDDDRLDVAVADLLHERRCRTSFSPDSLGHRLGRRRASSDDADEHPDRPPRPAARPLVPSPPLAAAAREASGAGRRSVAAGRGRGPEGAGEAAEAGCSWSHARARPLVERRSGAYHAVVPSHGQPRHAAAGPAGGPASTPRRATVPYVLHAVPGTRRQCSRPACAEPAAVTLTYEYGRSQVWLDDLTAERDPHAYDLCRRHAGALVRPARLAPRRPPPVGRTSRCSPADPAAPAAARRPRQDVLGGPVMGCLRWTRPGGQPRAGAPP